MRKIIQIAISDGRQDADGTETVEEGFIALCDDGTLWSRIEIGHKCRWVQIPGVPQDGETISEAEAEAEERARIAASYRERARNPLK